MAGLISAKDCRAPMSAAAVEHQNETFDELMSKHQRKAVSVRSVSQETVNAVSHGVGLLLSSVGTLFLMGICVRQNNNWLIIGCGIYSATLIMVYGASTLSHAIQHPRLKRLFRILDQCAIYLHIPGAFTPFVLVHLSVGSWWMLLMVMWGLAIWGFCSKLLRAHRIDSVSMSTYVILGWMPLIAAKPALELVPVPVLCLTAAGGLFYMAGLIFFLLDEKYRYFHAIWHLLVIAGSACHYAVILQSAMAQTA